MSLKKFAYTLYQIKFALIAIASPRKAARSAFRLFCTPYTKRKQLIAPPIFAKAESLSFQLKDNKVNGFRWQPDSANGKKILICHGFDSYIYKFAEFIHPLLNEGFEVLAFDAPAHGISQGSQITMPAYKEMILEIHHRFGPVDGIMAHSLGGLAAALALEQMKDNEHKRFVLIAPLTESSRAVQTFFQHIKVSTRVKQVFEKLIIEIGGMPTSWYSVARVMQSITTPTLWIHDEDDKLTPYDDMKHLLNKQLTHIRFEITKGLGHSLYRDKNVAEKIVAFLSGLKDEQVSPTSSAM